MDTTHYFLEKCGIFYLINNTSLPRVFLNKKNKMNLKNCFSHFTLTIKYLPFKLIFIILKYLFGWNKIFKIKHWPVVNIESSVWPDPPLLSCFYVMHTRLFDIFLLIKKFKYPYTHTIVLYIKMYRNREKWSTLFRSLFSM